MDTLYFAFANQSTHPLKTLQEEDDTLNRLLAPRAKQQHFILQRDSFITVDKLISYLTLYKEELALFLFSGHAGKDTLLLTDQTAHGKGIAQMLGHCPNLKLVFLNGCSTDGQVAQLLEQGVPAVIASSAPVDDRKATFFSIHFFEALQQQFNLETAFQMAKGAMETAFGSIEIGEYRDALWIKEPKEQARWGLFVHPDRSNVLNWKLPLQQATSIQLTDYTPNQYLINQLFSGLKSYNTDVNHRFLEEQKGLPVALSKKRMVVLNALPAPLAEPLRKLMVPVADEDQGYDKVSMARIKQIGQAFTTSMELLSFTLLAQLWEIFDDLGALNIESNQLEVLEKFFKLGEKERLVYDFLPFLSAIHAIFENNKVKHFIEELEQIYGLTTTDQQFSDALMFLNGLRLQVNNVTLEQHELMYFASFGEENLAYLYEKLGFLARYKLATIQGIDVEKYRHLRDVQYTHATVILHDLLGGFELSPITLAKSLDNRSVLLINEENWEYLNLSPFVIDENAFQGKGDVCKLYFFSHFSKQDDVFSFKYVNKPEDPQFKVSAQKYPLIKAQFEAFASFMFHKSMKQL